MSSESVKSAPSLQRFGERLQSALEARGKSQSWLADECGLSASIVSRLVSGDREPKPEHVIGIASILACSIADLLDGTEQADLLIGWVRVEEIKRVQERCAVAEQAAESLRAQLGGATARADSLLRSVEQLTKDLDVARSEAAHVGVLRESERAAHEQLRTAQDGLRACALTIRRLESNNAAIEAEAMNARRSREEALAIANSVAVERDSWRRRAELLNADNEALRGQRNTAGIVAGLSLLKILTDD